MIMNTISPGLRLRSKRSSAGRLSSALAAGATTCGTGCTEYFESTDPFSNLNPRLGISPGAPLTAIGTLRVEF